ncbi:hypothetical protein BJY01DRAFT_239519 [Aspergillus pseudoustus]|uniref:F-box domain-containing protein n=1 Tax=Aspergillus pseudoustus TaxID=1810923 RepID=A0ABR4J0A8_9EURO
MATGRVLRLPELFEQILTNLPMRDLLLAQRVCRRWKEFILSSRRLKHKLFLQTPRSCPQPEASTNIEFNPLLQDMFPGFFAHLETLDWGNVDDAPAGRIPPRWDYSVQRTPRELSLEEQEWYRTPTKREAVLRPEASWRRMFPSHPPPRLVDFQSAHVGCSCGGAETLISRLTRQYERFNRNPGARMWLIWDAVMHVLDDFPDGFFSASWWRRTPVTMNNEGADSQGKTWILELAVNTEHFWECYRADEAYKGSELRISDSEDIIEYDDYRDYMETINKHEAPPVSVMRKSTSARIRELSALSDCVKH